MGAPAEPAGGDEHAAAGTEVNQEPGLGDSQAPRQAAKDSGATEDGIVTELIELRDAAGFVYPPLDDTLEITVAPY